MEPGLSAFDIHALVHAAQIAVGARVEKVYQLQRKLILRLKHAEHGRLDLHVFPGRWACVSRAPLRAPESVPPFAAGLRRRLSGARVTAVDQHEFDRVIEVRTAKGEEELLLVLELFGNGNVILVREGRVLLAFSRQSFAHREIRPGSEFRHPPARVNPLLLRKEDLASRLSAAQAPLVNALAVDLNLGGPHAEELCRRAGVEKGRAAASVGPEELAALHAALRQMLDEAGSGSVHVRSEGGAPVWVGAVLLGGAPVERLPALEGFELLLQAFARETPDVGAKERARLERQRAMQERKLQEFEREAAEARALADGVYALYPEVEALLREAREAKATAGWEGVKRWAKSGGARRVEPERGRIVTTLPGDPGQLLPLKLGLSLEENAAELYEHSKTLRQKAEGAADALRATRATLESVRGNPGTAPEASATAPRKEKRFWFEAYRWFVSSEGILVVAGRDAGSNERLVKKHLAANDLYAHADVHGAASVVVKDGRRAGEATRREACAFAACHSKAWAAGHASSEAYWVLPSQVSKTPDPGQHLARGAFVVRGKRNGQRAVLRLAVGEVVHEGARKIMGGPPEALKARSRRYAVVEPGATPKDALAKEVAALLGASVDAVASALPPGPGRIVERVGVSA